MAQEIGEVREKWGQDVWNMAEDFANNMKKVKRPFYIVYACKEDKGLSNKFGQPTFKQTMKAYYGKPPALLGILVWFVNNRQGEFKFCPELSAPYDVPLDPKLLSTKSEDSSDRVAAQGANLNVLIS